MVVLLSLMLGAVALSSVGGARGSLWGGCCLVASFWFSLCLVLTTFVGSGGGWGAHIGFDVVGALFVVLTMCIVSLSFLAMVLGLGGVSVPESPRVLVCLVLLGMFLVGVFCISLGLVFFISFELCVVPIFLLITEWGSQHNRILSSYYFMFYSIVAPAPMLLCVVAGVVGGEAYFDSVYLSAGLGGGWLLAFGLALGFLAKLPLFGLHIWLPKAHVDAPVGGSMVLAGVMLKMGAYGMVRLVQMELLKSGGGVGLVVFVLGAVGFVASGFICLRLVDYKVIVAFSSVSHMSLAVSCLVLSWGWALTGGFFVFMGHGVVSPALFFLGGVLYMRSGSRLTVGGGGVSSIWGSPMFFLVLGAFMFNFGFPPFINFFGEVGLFWSIFSVSAGVCVFVAVGYVVTGVYLVNLGVSMLHGGPVGAVGGSYSDRDECSAGEWVVGLVCVASYLLLSFSVSKVI